MTVDTLAGSATTLADLHAALKKRVEADRAGVRVGELVVEVAALLGIDIDRVTAAMWDLVERGDFRYGTDARVTTQSN